MDEFEQIIAIRSNKIDLLNTDNNLQTKFNNTILLQPICFYSVHDRGKFAFSQCRNHERRKAKEKEGV